MHSPPPTDCGPPSARLAAVTRKGNEVKILMDDLPTQLPLVRMLYTQYLQKIENLLAASGVVHPDCLDPHKLAMTSTLITPRLYLR